MRVEQLSVFLENRSGRLAVVIETLARAGLEVLGLSLADMADFGILHVVVDATPRAEAALREAGFTVARTPVTAVQVPGGLDGLSAVLRALEAASVNVEYMYALLLPGAAAEGRAYAFRFEQAETGALAALGVAGARVLGPEELARVCGGGEAG